MRTRLHGHRDIFFGRTGFRYFIPTNSFVVISTPLNTSLYLPLPTFLMIWYRSGFLEGICAARSYNQSMDTVS